MFFFNIKPWLKLSITPPFIGWAPIRTTNQQRWRIVAFAEEFAAERLERVFGPDKVFRNVDIWKSKGAKFGEVDTLVLFANRAIVVQTKSKKLTLAARQGNDLQLKGDFKKAVQDACDQAYLCSEQLLGAPSLVTMAREMKFMFRLH